MPSVAHFMYSFHFECLSIKQIKRHTYVSIFVAIQSTVLLCTFVWPGCLLYHFYFGKFNVEYSIFCILEKAHSVTPECAILHLKLQNFKLFRGRHLGSSRRDGANPPEPTTNTAFGNPPPPGSVATYFFAAAGKQVQDTELKHWPGVRIRRRWTRRWWASRRADRDGCCWRSWGCWDTAAHLGWSSGEALLWTADLPRANHRNFHSHAVTHTIGLAQVSKAG